MKKELCLGLLLLNPFSSYWATNEVEVFTNTFTSSVTCYVSCPTEGGFPDVLKVYPCNKLPAMSESCYVRVEVTIKKDLKLAIDALQTLTDLKKEAK